MATEFKVVFEGEINSRLAAQINAAIQSAVLDLVVANFPAPEGPDPSPTGPGGPVQLSGGDILLRGIVFDPDMSIQTGE